MASSPAAVAPEYSRWGILKPTDGGLYVLQEDAWFCVLCRAFAAESHLSCVRHRQWLDDFLDGRYRPMASIQDMVLPGNAPPPPPGQPTDDRPGPPPAYPPRGQAAMSEENVMLRDAKLAIILEKLHTKLDMILTKVGAMEARLDKLEWKIDAWSNWE